MWVYGWNNEVTHSKEFLNAVNQFNTFCTYLIIGQLESGLRV